MRNDERGASLIEFALVLPVFFMLVLGMFTGGIAYNRKLVLTQATREAARYGATLPLSNFGAPPANKDLWLDAVAAVGVASAENELALSAPDRYLCVAYVFQPGSSLSETRRRVQVDGGAPSYDGGVCFDDQRPGGETRVQVVAARSSTLEALVFAHNLVLRSQAVARYEALP